MRLMGLAGREEATTMEDEALTEEAILPRTTLCLLKIMPSLDALFEVRTI